MQLYLGCTLVSNLIHSLMLSNMFSAGGGAIYDAPKARGGTIFDAHKPRGDAIFVAHHWNVLIKNAKFQKINLPSIYSFLYTIQSKYLLEFISQEKNNIKMNKSCYLELTLCGCLLFKSFFKSKTV